MPDSIFSEKLGCTLLWAAPLEGGNGLSGGVRWLAAYHMTWQGSCCRAVRGLLPAAGHLLLVAGRCCCCCCCCRVFIAGSRGRSSGWLPMRAAACPPLGAPPFQHKREWKRNGTCGEVPIPSPTSTVLSLPPDPCQTAVVPDLRCVGLNKAKV